MFPENSSYVDLIETMDDVIALHEEINSLPLGTVVYTSGQGSLCMGEDNAIEWYDRFKKKG
ncbi:MAG: hypothetical protein U9Q15_04715, partial [Patescibacteria group bacterium]|nr:hypothetical protein [Patescibacteria group bacterium]